MTNIKGKLIFEDHKDNLSRPFEKPETKAQRKLHSQIRALCKQRFVVQMSYPELFDVLDRVKLGYQIDMLRRMERIEKKIKGKWLK